jgi:DNA-binding transcriptional ArsR family regulator
MEAGIVPRLRLPEHVDLFAALGDPARRAVLKRLAGS